MKEILVTAAVGLAMLGGQPAGQVPQQQTQQQQNAIPDAPKPQITGVTGTVAPGKGTTLSDNIGSSSTKSDADNDPDQKPIPSSLPPTAPSLPDEAPDPGLITLANGQGPDAYKLILNVQQVEIPFTVKDKKGHLVPGIQGREVRVYENGVRQQLKVFTVDPFPLSVAIVIDQSLNYDVMTRVNNALGQLSNVFAAYDEVAVFTYNNGPKMQTDFTGGTSPRLTAVLERTKSTGREPLYYAPGEALQQGININNNAQQNITPLTSHGPGSIQGVDQVPREPHTLNDAILAAANAVSKAAPGRRRVVYVISDGKEYGSVAKPKEVTKYLNANRIQVYATLVGDSSVSGLGFVTHLHLPMMMRDNILPAYTAATGGECYADYRTKGIEESFQKVTEEERTQYTIYYNTQEPLIDGKYRKIEVKVLRPDLEVIAKDGYYPSAFVVPPRPVARPVSTNPAAATPPAPVPPPSIP